MAAPAVARTTDPDGERSRSAETVAPGIAARPPFGRAVTGVLGVLVAAGIALRIGTTSALWLDETLSVNIATRPLGDLFDALREDGAPPLYYLLLHGWTKAFGTGDMAVRLLSAVFSVATVAVLYRMGRRRGGSLVAVAALVLYATSPYAIRYATEARMYSLVALLAALGWMAVRNVLDRPSPAAVVATGACAGLLLLTHYWAFYLLGVTTAALLVTAWRAAGEARLRRNALVASAAIGTGALVLFGPWLPTFLFQLRHTGAPWGTAPGPVEVAFTSLTDLGGGSFPEGQALAGLLAILGLLAIFGAPIDATRVELDLQTQPGVRAEAIVGGLTLLAGVAVGFATSSAWASRYNSVAVPLLFLVVAFGLRAFADRRLAAAALVLVAALGVAGGARNVFTDRTQAPEVAAAVVENGRRGDVVAYCPDQLGPDVRRALPEGFDHVTFPELADARLVNWVDYADRMAAGDPDSFANAVLARADGRNVFYVWMPGYRTLDKKCEAVNSVLASARPGARQLVEPREAAFEKHVLWVYPAAP
ncbi:MAG TPA: glycosyltransferase family 39 protein [Acidimicrobiales bacterium]